MRHGDAVLERASRLPCDRLVCDYQEHVDGSAHTARIPEPVREPCTSGDLKQRRATFTNAPPWCASEHVPHQALHLQSSCAEDADMMARKEHTTSRVGHHVQVLVVVCPAATAAPLSTERACGAVWYRQPSRRHEPLSGDEKQQRAQKNPPSQITVSAMRQPKCSVIAGCCRDVAGDWRARLPKCHERHAVLRLRT
jgi:hypothetical protein